MQCLLDWGLSTIHGAITSICKSLSKSLASWSCCGVEVSCTVQKTSQLLWYVSILVFQWSPNYIWGTSSVVVHGDEWAFGTVPTGLPSWRCRRSLRWCSRPGWVAHFLVCNLSIQLAICRNLQLAVPWSCLWVVWTWLQCQKSYSKFSFKAHKAIF